MRWLLALVAVCCATSIAFAQEAVELGPIELVIDGAPEDVAHDAQPSTTGVSWQERLTPAIRLGIIAIAIGVPMGLVLLGRFWRSLPETDRIIILLCAAMGRGRGFRKRVRSLSGAAGPGGRPITPVAMLLAPRAFDEALANATHAERAFGQPLRHAVHGFRKS